MVTRLVEGKEWLAKVIKGEAQGQFTE